MFDFKNIIKKAIDNIVYSISIINLTLIILHSLDILVVLPYEIYKMLTWYATYCLFFISLICLNISKKIGGKYENNNKLINYICLALCTAIFIYWYYYTFTIHIIDALNLIYL